MADRRRTAVGIWLCGLAGAGAAVAVCTAPGRGTVASTSTREPPSRSTVPTPPPGPIGASDVQLLSALRVAPEVDPGGYDREVFGYPAAGTDSRGCNSRARVLLRDSTLPAQVTFPASRPRSVPWCPHAAHKLVTSSRC